MITSTCGRVGVARREGLTVGRGVGRGVRVAGVGDGVGDSVDGIVGAEVMLGAGVGVALLARLLAPPQAASTEPMRSIATSLPIGVGHRLRQVAALASKDYRPPLGNEPRSLTPAIRRRVADRRHRKVKVAAAASAAVTVLVLLTRSARTRLVSADLTLRRSTRAVASAGAIPIAVRASRARRRRLDDVAHDRLGDDWR
jgi:hypothetical protein